VRDASFANRNLGLLVSSEEPISVVLVSYTTGSTPHSTYLALPSHSQPTSQYIYYGISHGSSQADRHSQILLVGCMDDTTVTIIPSQDVTLPADPQLSNSSTIDVSSGSNHTITLNSLQTLLISVTMKMDLSGTKIISNRPLTVVGGHECASVPLTVSSCDPMATQVPPTINWGTEFLLTPLVRDSTFGQTYKILKSEPNTNVTYKCGTSPVTELSPTTNSFQLMANNYCYLSCSQPCFVSELAFSGSHPIPGSVGDPLLMAVPPIQQYLHSVSFIALPQMPLNYYSIILPADDYYNRTVIINNVSSSLSFTPILSTDGSVVGHGYHTSASGPYTITHIHPNGVLYANVYGFITTMTTIGGYGYLTGTNLNPLTYISFNSSTYTTSEGSGDVIVYIRRKVKLSISVSLVVKTVTVSSNNSAKMYSDYMPLNEVVMFSSGEMLKQVAIPIINDDVTEEMEYFSVKLEVLVDGVPLLVDTASIIIEDNDSVMIGFKNTSLVISNEEQVVLDVVLSNGQLQNGLRSSLLLRIENGGQSFVVSQFDFYSSVTGISVVYNFTQAPANVNSVVQLIKDGGSSINAIIEPSALTIISSIVPTTTSSIISTMSPTVQISSGVATVTTTVTIESSTVQQPSVVTVTVTVNSTDIMVAPNCSSTEAALGALIPLIIVICVIVTIAVAIFMFFLGKRLSNIKTKTTDNDEHNGKTYSDHK
jgi:hypothetical protein